MLHAKMLEKPGQKVSGYSLSFTIVELLVVISIIGILASLLLPALKKAKDSAKAISCVNNLKQIGLSVFMYADDNKNMVPGWIQKSTSDPIETRWVAVLAPYTVTATLWVCPASVDAGEPEAALLKERGVKNMIETLSSLASVQTIGINGYGTADRAFYYSGQRLDYIKNASSLVYAGDATGNANARYAPNNPNLQLPIISTPYIWPDAGPSYYPHHKSTVNFLALAGNVMSPSTSEARRWCATVGSPVHSSGRWYFNRIPDPLY